MFLTSLDVSFDRYDVIIAGSGPAGVTVARELAAKGKRSLILETGLRDFDGDINEQYSKVYATGHYGPGYWENHWIRGFGGTSAVWSGWCAPLTARNLADWPITLSDLAPYYPKAAAVLGRPPDFLTYEAPFLAGFDARPFSRDDPLRVADAYAAEVSQDGDVDVLLGTNLTALLANPARSFVSEIEIFHRDAGLREFELREGQQLVLAAGGMGNAQILLASQNGGDVGIGNETGQVGRYLMEHPHFYGAARLVASAEVTIDDLPERLGPTAFAIVPGDKVFERMGSLDASFSFEDSDINPDDPVERYVAEMLAEGARAYELSVRSEMPPDPRNRVVLSSERDPSGLPRLRANCVVAESALNAVHDYLREFGEAAARENFGRLRIDNSAVFDRIRGGGHIMGTTRMGDDPAISVVDRNCRLHGYRNLSIAGSSVFTSGGYANPTLTIVALAARLADQLVENL